jgi:predicted  nucleic acid-binding Zn-ribbon protein
MALFAHRRPLSPHYRPSEPVLPDIKHNMSDLYRQRHMSKRLDRGLHKLRKEAKTLHEHPEEAGDVQLQIKRLLPAQGYLTQRMAQLRAKAHQIRNGHIARLEETRHAFAKLPASAKKKAAAELAARYNQMVGIDTRLERLDKAVAENEKRIRELTSKAQEYTARYDHRRLVDTLKAAEKLQHHNSRLFNTIKRTEDKLSTVAKKVATEVKQIEKRNERAKA